MTDNSYWNGKTILLTGGAGFLGSKVAEKLVATRAVSSSRIRIPRSKDTDLRKAEDCRRIAKDADIVIHLAAKVGGIGFNQKYPGSLFYDNAVMGINLLETARRNGVSKFVQVGTVCGYPKFAPVPFKEEDLWNGYPEETNAPYGIAKKSLLVMAQAYRQQYGMNVIFLIPSNLYGPRDNFHLGSSHVIPALIRKFIEARTSESNTVTVWGTGNASREFLYVDDAAEGIVLAAEGYEKADPVNLGTGKEVTIRDLVNLIARLTKFGGRVRWDTSKPDGQPRRMLDTSRAWKEFGFRAQIDLEEGLRRTIDWYQRSIAPDR